MKVCRYNGGLMIGPETEFEEDWLKSKKIGKVFHKHGLTAAEYLCLRIEFTGEFEPPEGISVEEQLYAEELNERDC